MPAVMRESLRLSPTASTRTVTALEDAEIIGGDGDPLNSSNKNMKLRKVYPSWPTFTRYMPILVAGVKTRVFSNRRGC